MKTNRKEYTTPAAETVTILPATMLAGSIALGGDDDYVDTEGGDGGWANKRQGSWGDLWSNM
jgi:hypothetical protein